MTKKYDPDMQNLPSIEIDYGLVPEIYDGIVQDMHKGYLTVKVNGQEIEDRVTANLIEKLIGCVDHETLIGILKDIRDYK